MSDDKIQERIRKQLAIANRRLAIAEVALKLYRETGNWHDGNETYKFRRVFMYDAQQHGWEPAANALAEMEAVKDGR